MTNSPETLTSPRPEAGPLRDAEATQPDFLRREYALRELMDEPCAFADYRRAALDLAQVNWLTRGTAPTLAFLDRIVDRIPDRIAALRHGVAGASRQPLHIVDVGYASGDTLRAVRVWAARRGAPVRLTGVDINPYAAQLAQELDLAAGVAQEEIDWRVEDIFTAQFDAPPDIVLASLMTHHLDEATIVRFLAWCEQNTRVGWMINDLERSERSARWFGRLAGLLRWHRFVRYDGPVSFRRAFSREDWEGYLAAAGIEQARVYGFRPGRLCVERIKL